MSIKNLNRNLQSAAMLSFVVCMFIGLARCSDDEPEELPVEGNEPDTCALPGVVCDACLLPGIDCPAPGDTLDLDEVTPSTPNIVIFYTDDQGYGDVNVFGGGNVMTPNIDRLASEGMIFTDFYSPSSVCSPARAGMLTGCYPSRVSVNNVYQPEATQGLKSSETTIADIAKSMGYATTMIGKWHLGHREEFLPPNHGFDEFFGIPYSNDMWPRDYKGDPITNPNNGKADNPPLRIIDGFTPLDTIDNMEDQGLLTRRFTERAVDFIDRNQSNPFLMVLTHPMPHVPLAVSPEFQDTTGLGIYADVIFEIDWSVGQVLEKLATLGLENNTLVIFATDNGPWLRYGTHGGSNGGLREGKTTLFDGGFKVPCVMKWPAKIQAGSTYNEMASAIDILPTIAELLGAPLPPQPIDGISMTPVVWHGLLDRPYRREYYFYRNGDLFALRLNNMKYLLEHNYDPVDLMTIFNDGRHGVSQSVTFSGGLFDIMSDNAEANNLLDTSSSELIDLFETKADSVKRLLGSKVDGYPGTGVR